MFELRMAFAGKEYETDDLSEDARNNLVNTKYCDDKLAQLKREQAIVQSARNAGPAKRAAQGRLRFGPREPGFTELS